LELKSLAAYTDILDPHLQWDKIFGGLKRAIDYAAEAQTKFIVTESGGMPGELNKWDELIKRFSQLAKYAESCEVGILVENGPGVLVNDTELMLKMMKELNSDYIGVNFDPANLNLIPGDVVDAVFELGDFIKDTHAKDSILLLADSDRKVPEEHIFVMPEGEEFIHLPEDITWILPPVGEGDVPFYEYLSALHKINFNGDLIIEYQGGGDREQAIVQSKRYLEGILQKIL